MEETRTRTKIAASGIALSTDVECRNGGKETVSTLAIKAVKRCLENMEGFDVQKIDAIILATGLPDNYGTSTATLVKKDLGIAECAVHDITAGEAGFLYALCLAESYIKNGMYENILTIASDTPTTIIGENSKEKSHYVDAAGAVLLQGNTESSTGFLGFYLGSNTAGEEIISYPVGGSRYPISYNAVMRGECFVELEEKGVMENSINNILKSIQSVVNDTYKIESSTRIIFPQYMEENYINKITTNSGLFTEEQVLKLKRTGNSAGASIVISLHEFLSGHIQEQIEQIILTAADGMSYGAAIYQM